MAKPANQSSGVRTVSLDAFTIAALRRHLAMLDAEQHAFGPTYPGGGWLLVWQNGQRPHPDTVTDRFNQRHPPVAQGGDLQTVKDLLEHSSIGVTSAIYVDVLRQVQRDAVDRLSHLFGSGNRPTRQPKCGQNCGQGRFLRGSALALWLLPELDSNQQPCNSKSNQLTGPDSAYQYPLAAALADHSTRQYRPLRLSRRSWKLRWRSPT
jgi:hypothetical protein